MGLEEKIKACQELPGEHHFRKEGKTIGGAKVVYCGLNVDYECPYKGGKVYIEVMPCVYYKFLSCKAMEEIKKD